MFIVKCCITVITFSSRWGSSGVLGLGSLSFFFFGVWIGGRVLSLKTGFCVVPDNVPFFLLSISLCKPILDSKGSRGTGDSFFHLFVVLPV